MTGISRPLLSAVIAVVIFAVGAAAGWIGRGMHSGPDVPTIAIYDGWRLACPPLSQTDQPCAISNDLVDAKSQRRVAQLTIVPTKSGTILAITAPYDVLLTAGVGLAVGDGKPRLYSYQTCNGTGCIATIPIDDAMRDAMLHAKTGKLLFGSLNQRAISVLFSLQGFDRADKALEARQHHHGFLGMAI
jgi:invasion protein IalB